MTTSTAPATHLVWFRADLRATDNTALHHAAAAARAAGQPLVALFVLSPGEWQEHDFSPAKVDLIRRTLRVLSADLAAINIPLMLAHAATRRDVPGVVLAEARRLRASAIFFNREYEVNERARDERVEALAKEAGIAARSFTDQTVLAPDLPRTGNGTYFTVFSPFKRAWLKLLPESDTARVLPAPRAQAASPGLPVPSPIPDRIDGFDAPRFRAPADDLWPAGEHAAAARLSWFIEHAARPYKDARNFPAHDATSKLSPHLTVGSISPRQCLRAAIDANRGVADGGNDGLTHWISELVWRDFYVHVMLGFPRVVKGRAFQLATEGLRWSDNAEHLAAWTEGRTGIPIVDAGMRQMHAEGWMHNRVRMITAMFMSKNLFLHWREGERVFMRHLIDGFFASNNGGWQWSASTGTDAAPYFRIMNPVSQSQKFDPEGAYIRRYVPELAGVEGDAIHEPWTLPALLRSRLDYPAPIVDLSSSRQRAIAAFQALKGVVPASRDDAERTPAQKRSYGPYGVT